MDLPELHQKNDAGCQLTPLSPDMHWVAQYFPYPVVNGVPVRLSFHLEQQFESLVIQLLAAGIQVVCWEVEGKGFLMTSWKPQRDLLSKPQVTFEIHPRTE